MKLIDLMKRTSKSKNSLGPILAFGAHPDDIEFGCGGVIALEKGAHFVVCSRGEAGSNGSPDERIIEARKGSKALGATLEFIELDGDARLEVKTSHTIRLAEIIRRTRPAVVLAPSLVENQHPDHARLGRMVRDAARLARYGGFAELKSIPTHGITQLFYYAVTPEAEPRDITPVVVDVSSVVSVWRRSMEAHASQLKTRNYAELQLLRAQSLGARVGVAHAIALFPNDPIVVDSLEPVSRGARRF